MKIRLLMKFILGLTLVVSTLALRAQSKSDTAAIQAIIQEQVTAWNKGDALAYSQQFAQAGTFTNIGGEFFVGYNSFLDKHDSIFKGLFKNTVLQAKIISLRFLRPDVAAVETLNRVSGFPKTGLPPRLQLDGQGRLNTRMVQVLVNEGNDWKIVIYHNVDIKPGILIPEPD
jgi:uncharacterized protein (TIGR02246 family)